MSGQSQISKLTINKKSVLITETLSKFMDANIGGKSTEQRATVPTISPSLPFPSVRLNRHFCLYRVYCVKFTDPSIKQKRKF